MNLKKKVSFLTILFILFGFSFQMFAQEKQIEEMSLEELLNTEITSVSKKAEKISESPGIITIITQARLKELGITNLLDALSYVPGISVMETYWREPIVTVRGIMESLYNDKILLLINGLPAFEGVNGASYFEAIPINGIERIEVIRGPGSVLYGTNAFTGVINVVMKTGEKQNGLNVDLSGGSFNRKTLMATYGKKLSNIGKKTDGLDYLVSIMYTDDNGYPKKFKYDERTTFDPPYEYPYENDIFNIYGSVAQKDVKFFGTYWTQTQNKFGMVPILGYGGPAEHTGFDFGLKYDHKFSDNLSYSGSGRYTYMKRFTRVGYNANEVVPGWSGGFIANGDFSLYKGSVYTLDNYVTSSILQNLDLVAGASYEKIMPKNLYTMFQNEQVNPNLTGSNPFPPPDADSWATYLQTNYSYNDIKITGGVRYSDFGKDIGTSTTPRFGVLFKYLKNNHIRLLYGNAFRAPTLYERYVLVPGVLIGTSKLKPEKVSTSEASIDYNIGGKIITKATLFNSKIKDLIVRQTIGGVPTYVNSTDEQIVNGIELEAEGNALDNLNLFTNLSYKDADNKTGDTPVYYIEKYLANIGVKYLPIEPLTVGLNIQYVGSRRADLSAQGKVWVGGPGAKVKIPSYTLLNLDTNYKIDKNASVYFGIKNILNTEYKFPEHLRRRIDAIPGGHERSFYFGARYNME